MNTFAENKFRIFSGSMLKLLAILCMAIDHSAAILWPVVDFMRLPVDLLGRTVSVYWIMRKIGRLAFPIFCFLIAEGYVHTRNKLKYGLRLLIFAVISEIPFNLLHGGTLLDPNGQNVFWTLLFGLSLIYVYDLPIRKLIKFPAMFAIAGIALVFKADYGLKGTLLVYLLYLLRDIPVVIDAFGDFYGIAGFCDIHRGLDCPLGRLGGKAVIVVAAVCLIHIQVPCLRRAVDERDGKHQQTDASHVLQCHFHSIAPFGLSGPRHPTLLLYMGLSIRS